MDCCPPAWLCAPLGPAPLPLLDLLQPAKCPVKSLCPALFSPPDDRVDSPSFCGLRSKPGIWFAAFRARPRSLLFELGLKVSPPFLSSDPMISLVSILFLATLPPIFFTWCFRATIDQDRTLWFLIPQSKQLFYSSIFSVRFEPTPPQ